MLVPMCSSPVIEGVILILQYIFFLVVVMAGELAAGILAAIYRGQVSHTARQVCLT